MCCMSRSCSITEYCGVFIECLLDRVGLLFALKWVCGARIWWL